MSGAVPRFRHPRLAATILLAASCAFSLLIAEGFVRVFFPHTRDGVVPAALLGMDARLGWRLQPSRTAIHETKYFKAAYKINAIGYRDRERVKPLAPGASRALLMGDSQIFGWGVDEDQRFSNRLERACPGLEVWNTGVPGYGFDQELLAYERDAADVPATDAVLYLSSATMNRSNTDYIFSKSKPRFILDEQGRLKLHSTPGNRAAVGSVLHGLLAPFYLPYFIQSRLAMLSGSGSSAASNAKPAVETVSDLAKALILRTQSVAAARGQRFVLLAVFRGKSLDDLRLFCIQHGVTMAVFDSRPDAPGAIFGPEDPHWTALTHARLAEELKPVLCGGGVR